MRLVLEKADLVKIISRHFGEEFADNMVKVSADPFEVELQGIPLTPSEKDSLPAPDNRKLPLEQTPQTQPRLSGEADGLSGTWRIEPPRLPDQPEEEIARMRSGSGSTTPPEYTDEEMSGDAIGDLVRKSREMAQREPRVGDGTTTT